MRDRYQLGSRENGELLAELSALVARGNDLTGDLLAHLAELDERRLHLELGHPSLFAYCTESLGLSEPAAGRRIAAARVCRKFPEAFELVARGELHLSALCALGPHLDAANANELFRACKHKTRRQIDELLAARFPAPDVRAQIRRLPARPAIAPATMALVGDSPAKPAESERRVEAEMPCQIGDSAPAPGPAPPPQPPRAQRRAIEPLSAGRFGVHFTSDARLREKIEQARALARHRLPSGDLAGLFELAIDTLIRELEKQRFAVGRKPRALRSSAESNFTAREALSPGESFSEARAAKTSRAANSSSRHIPAAVAREV